MVVGLAVLLSAPVSRKHTLSDEDKFLQMGYSLSEIRMFSEEKQKKLSSYRLISSAKAVTHREKEENVRMIGTPCVDNRETRSLVQKEDKARVSDGTKEMVTTLSLVETDGKHRLLLLKSNVVWQELPKERFSDLITFQFTDNYFLRKKNNYPDIEMGFNYHYYHYYYHHSISTHHYSTNEDIKNQYDGSNTNVYHLDLQKSCLTFQFDLPKDYSREFSRSGRKTIEKKIYSAFSATMEATFENVHADAVGGAFQSLYTHQIDTGRIDWGKISFTWSKPFIQYETNFFVDDPGFEEPLANYMTIRLED